VAEMTEETDINCPHCGKNIFEGKFWGWIAIPLDDQEYFEDPESYAHQWGIVTKEFWNKQHCLDDSDPILQIPKFGQSMESCYEYVGSDKLSVEEQAELLRKYGFEVLPITEWAKDDH
jgi:hypothetical protein